MLASELLGHFFSGTVMQGVDGGMVPVSTPTVKDTSKA